MPKIENGVSRSRQRGLTAVGWLATLLVVVSAVTLTLKLVPHYIDFYTIKSIVEALPEGDVHRMSRPAINEALEKRFLVNNLRDLRIRDIITIERGRDGTELIVAYERRENLFLNIDVVISFTERYHYQ